MYKGSRLRNSCNKIYREERVDLLYVSHPLTSWSWPPLKKDIARSTTYKLNIVRFCLHCGDLKAQISKTSPEVVETLKDYSCKNTLLLKVIRVRNLETPEMRFRGGANRSFRTSKGLHYKIREPKVSNYGTKFAKTSYLNFLFIAWWQITDFIFSGVNK